MFYALWESHTCGIRPYVQNLLEKDLPRVLSLLILSYLEENAVYKREIDELSMPGGVISLPCGELVVTNMCNRLIQVFTPEGEFLREWGKYGLGELGCPSGIATLSSSGGFDSSYEVVIADSVNHCIQVFDSKGKFLRTWGGEKFYPYAVTTLRVSPNPSEEIFVVDVHQHRIQVFTPKGKFLRMWGKYGHGRGEFNYPYGIAAAPSGKIFVADTRNHRIQVFDTKGKFLYMWGKEGREAGEFLSPYSIASSPTGEVLVSDSGNHRIQVFNAEGKFLYMWGKKGKGLGEFDFPCEITSLLSGEIAVADSFNERVQIFRIMLG